MQVVEFQPAEAFDLVRAGPRVGHHGVDQVVEIDIFDVEGLAHIAAAVAQKLDDLGLVRNGVEFGFDRVRPGHDLAERNGRGKNLNEDGFHRHVRRLEGGLPLGPRLYKMAQGRSRFYGVFE